MSGQRRTPQRARTKASRDAFLDALSKLGVVGAACQAAGVSRSMAYEWRADDAGFRAAWDDALAEAADVLEREAVRRATVGVDEPVYYRGERVGNVRRYSDTLLLALLKARKPEAFRERSTVQHEGSADAPVVVDIWRADVQDAARALEDALAKPSDG